MQTPKLINLDSSNLLCRGLPEQIWTEWKYVDPFMINLWKRPCSKGNKKLEEKDKWENIRWEELKTRAKQMIQKTQKPFLKSKHQKAH